MKHDTNDDPIYDLRKAIDGLTKPVSNAEWIRHADKTAIYRRTDKSLLEQIKTAIHSDIGGGGSGQPGRERVPLDVGAFTIHETIDGRIRAWMDDIGGLTGKDLTASEVLRAWFPLWKFSQREPSVVDAFTRIIEGWAQQIRDHLDPPAKFEITSKCPACGMEWITTGSGTDAETTRVLSAVERETLEDSYAVCRACDKVWRGVAQMRKLRIAIDDMDLAEQTALTG